MNFGSDLQADDFDSSGSCNKQDEPSSSHKSENFEEALENFRLKWQKELKITSLVLSKNNPDYAANEEDHESKAKRLFLKGVELEKSGNLYEAIQSYRRAEQLVPDIELRLEEFKRRCREYCFPVFSTPSRDSLIGDDDDTATIKGNLLHRIQRKLNKSTYLCAPNTMTKEVHMSALPPEIILYILHWVISSDLDVRSLEMFSQVCRGFYVCARDSEIWKSVCKRVWGINCGNLSNNYGSWREMFLERVKLHSYKLHFNGCYISRATYSRQKESSFQDQFFKPWLLITYYRYLRFFPEGIVLMLTTADEPSISVGLLKSRYPKGTSILKGHYHLKDDTITIYVHQQEPKQPSYKGGGRKEAPCANSERIFHLELKIQSHHKQRHVQLVWTRYSAFTKSKAGVENNCTFGLGFIRFPPLWFSRVESYTSESESPLD